MQRSGVISGYTKGEIGEIPPPPSGVGRGAELILASPGQEKWGEYFKENVFLRC